MQNNIKHFSAEVVEMCFIEYVVNRTYFYIASYGSK